MKLKDILNFINYTLKIKYWMNICKLNAKWKIIKCRLGRPWQSNLVITYLDTWWPWLPCRTIRTSCTLKDREDDLNSRCLSCTSPNFSPCTESILCLDSYSVSSHIPFPFPICRTSRMIYWFCFCCLVLFFLPLFCQFSLLFDRILSVIRIAFHSVTWLNS